MGVKWRHALLQDAKKTMRVVIKPEQKIHICTTHHTKMSKYVTCQKYIEQTLYVFIQRQAIHIFITHIKCTR